MSETEPNLREQIVEHLALLSSLERQVAYARNVAIANVPAELFSVWSDDLDLPTSAALAFSGPALEKIIAFSKILDATSSELGELSFVQLQEHRSWLLVVAEAQRP